ncbi:splicing factor 3B subunit 3-like protein, partial [Tanacetum coccineum]
VFRILLKRSGDKWVNSLQLREAAGGYGDCAALNVVFAALELDYSEHDQGKHLTFYELDLGLNNVYRKSSQLVDDGANMLVAVPGGGDGPSGVLCSAVMKSEGFCLCSEFGNHALYQFQAIGTNPDVESSSTTSMETDDGLQPVLFKPRGLKNLVRIDQMESLMPLWDERVSQLLGVQTAFWTVKKNINDEFDAYIVVSFANATLVLSIGGETVEKVSDSGLFLGTTPSLGFSMIGDDSFMQVHPTGIRHIREDGRIDEWRTLGKQTIVKVRYNQFQVVIALSEGCKLFGYREDSNEAAFVVAAVEKIFAHESLTFNDTVACEVIFKWKAGLKDDMDARSDVYALSNGCRKCSDGYYWEYTPGSDLATKCLLDKAKGNVLGIEIIRDQSGSLKANLQHMEALSITKAGYMTFTEAWKKKIWLKGLLAESGYELSLVAVIATSALVKGGSWSEVPAQVEGIACAITGTFSSSGSQELVVARGKLLELLRLDKHDYIVVDSDSGLVSILAYNEHDNVFDIIHRETVGKSGCRRIVPGQYLALNPKGRALMIAACEKQKLVYVLSRDSAANLTISSPLETHKSCTVTYSIVGVDCGWDNPVFAALELDYSEPHQGKHLRFYELDLGLNNVYRKLSQRVDDGANMLVAVPGGGDGPSGVLVCAENFVIYKNQDPGHPDVCAVIPEG